LSEGEEEEGIWTGEEEWYKKGKRVVKIDDEVCIDLEEGMILWRVLWNQGFMGGYTCRA
jgi:hypothetical protein